MKKILKKGVINTSKKWVSHCPVCDTEFEYQAEDYYYNQRIHHVMVICPQCNNELYHKDNPYSQISTENF